MKRFHLHLTVTNLAESIRFYSALFGAKPTVSHPDYAKWLLDDPRVNFAISTRGSQPGIDHLGIQAESAEDLEELRGRLERAALPTATQEDASCCYARSNKHWTVDPQGMAWESFHTLDTIPVFGADSARSASPLKTAEPCCVPAVESIKLTHRQSAKPHASGAGHD